MPIERRKQILDMLTKQQSVRVRDLCIIFKVSEVTIRRDLESMEQDGLLERCHGGAVIGRHMITEPLFIQKQTSYLTAKQKIGALAATLIQEGETVFIGSGTTTLQIFQNLSCQELQIITTNIGAVTEARSQSMGTTLTGGNYREKSHSLLGPAALLTLQYYHANKCFIGTDGISPKHGLTTPLVEEATVLRMMLERTHGTKILLTDHSKFGVVASAKICTISEIDVIITDELLAPSYKQELESMGVQVLIAE